MTTVQIQPEPAAIHVALSGGLDSTCALAMAIRDHGHDLIHCWGFAYGQRHEERETRAAAQVARHYGVPYSLLALPTLSSPSLTEGKPVPLGHYADESMRSTIVKGRNLLLVANLVAQADPGDLVVIGVHAGDRAIYPDCRPAFVHPLQEAILNAYGVTLFAPWLSSTKADIVAAGATYGAPLGLTWSCYQGGDVHCGQCGTCYERREAFALAGVPDPTEYAPGLAVVTG